MKFPEWRKDVLQVGLAEMRTAVRGALSELRALWWGYGGSSWNSAHCTYLILVADPQIIEWINTNKVISLIHPQEVCMKSGLL